VAGDKKEIQQKKIQQKLCSKGRASKGQQSICKIYTVTKKPETNMY
jgi:hypothetical protein